ncbi:RagB/SusD family nutrient uptake outer membrane protein [Flexithrix dorotheae]|uniref:RagB/SusD family nutrient uptake outer membrane protein n=1 Tax=Flexithrix dorotheae TaxID=70993 RepID=UPI00146EAEEF|nr:RagB/SusD family nutrient uptake outer membrane protein [Flexithrix dorotheae]
MKNFNSLLLLIILSLFGCQDYFDLERPPQNQWTTVEEFERVPIALYASVYGGDNWNIPYVNYSLFKTSAGDDVAWVKDASWGYWRNTSEHNQWSKRNFNLLYRTIGAANDALSFVEDHDGNPYPDASPEDIANDFNRILGEIYFMRGMAYYYLQTTFGHAYQPGGGNNNPDIPLRTEYPSSLEEARNPKIGTTEEIFTFILEDFKKAAELLPEQYIDGLHHPSYIVRANKFAAISMIMKTQFLRGEYTEALQAANIIIDENKGVYDLSEDPIEAFNKSGLDRGREVIFYLPFYDNTLSTPHHLSVLNHTYENNTMCNWSETRMSITAIRALNWMDNPKNDTTINQTAWRDKRFTQLMAVRYPKSLAKPGQQFDSRGEIQNETTIWPFKFYRGPGLFNTNVPLIRLAEIYLTRSILRFNKGDLAGAAQDFNMVRKRAWDESVAGPYEEISAGNLTAEMIHNERLIEMFNEADRVEYLRALKMDIPNGDRGAGSEPYTSDAFIWAIPVDEKIYNENLN